MKKREPRLFSMMRTLLQLAHKPASAMRGGGQTNDAYLPLGVAATMRKERRVIAPGAERRCCDV
jgi:hypothetical protein